MLIGLVLLPTLVFFLYVGAYYRPLDNMANTPVLLVNMDGSETSLLVENAIVSTNVYSFRKVNYEYAKQAIAEGTEWAALVIPEDFTERLENKQDAEIVLLVDDSRSYVVTRVLGPTISTISERVNARMKAAASERLGEGLSAAVAQEKLTSIQLASASAGAGKIAEGQQALEEYSSTASVYTGEMGSSGTVIASNLKTAGYSADALRSGLITLQDGSSTLSSGLRALSNGTAQLKASHAALDGALAQSIAVAGTLDNSSAKTQLLYILNSAKNGSSLEYAGIMRLDSAATDLYAGSTQITGGMANAVSGSASLETGLFKLQRGQAALASSLNDEQLALSQISSAQGDAAKGSSSLSGGLALLSSKQAKIANSLSDGADAAYSQPSMKITVREANKTDYGTFFATAFVVLGLFFGAASAHIFSAITYPKKSLQVALLFCLAQTVVLLAVYLGMGFPAKLGAESLFIIFLLISVTFIFLARALTSFFGSSLKADSLQMLSPILSLLAVFMISSGGAIWPQHTLNEPFSQFAPYIPFNYATMAVRSCALAGNWPANEMLALALFCALFALVAFAVGKLGQGQSSAKLCPHL